MFSTYSSVLLVFGRPEHSSPSTDTQLALKQECHSKTHVQLKEFSPKASRRISGVSIAVLPSFTQNLMQTGCLILPFIADKTRHEVKKSTHVKTVLIDSAVSCGRLMQWACRSVTLASLLIFFHRSSYNNNSPGTFRYTSPVLFFGDGVKYQP
jgi:hypothetical protein